MTNAHDSAPTTVLVSDLSRQIEPPSKLDLPALWYDHRSYDHWTSWVRPGCQSGDHIANTRASPDEAGVIR
jgi:hypothetical protein